MEKDEQEFHIKTPKRNFFVTLNNGRRMDIRHVQAAMTNLRLLRKAHPLHFQALWDIVQGNPGNASGEHIHDLKEWRVLSKDGSIFDPKEREVLLSAGPELADPYKTDSIRDKLSAALAEEETEADFRKKVKKLLKPGKGGKQGRSPD